MASFPSSVGTRTVRSFCFFHTVSDSISTCPQARQHGDLSWHELSQHSVHGLADRSRHSNDADRSRRASAGVFSHRNGNSDANNTMRSITLQEVFTSVYHTLSRTDDKKQIKYTQNIGLAIFLGLSICFQKF